MTNHYPPYLLCPVPGCWHPMGFDPQFEIWFCPADRSVITNEGWARLLPGLQVARSWQPADGRWRVPS